MTCSPRAQALLLLSWTSCQLGFSPHLPCCGRRNTARELLSRAARASPPHTPHAERPWHAHGSLAWGAHRGLLGAQCGDGMRTQAGGVRVHRHGREPGGAAAGWGADPYGGGWALRASGLGLRARREGSRETEKPQDFNKAYLTYKGNRWPRDMFQFIVQDIGVPRDKISHVAEASQVMSLNISSNLQPKLDYFVDELQIPRKSLGRVVGAFPQLLTLSLQANIIPKLRYFSEELGVSECELGRLVMRHPQLLGLSLEQNIRPTVAFLLHEALLPPGKMPALVKRYPSILSLSVAHNLRPTLEYLRDTIGVDAQRLGWVLGVNPMLFSVSLQGLLKTTVSFYSSELRIPRRTLSTMIAAYPGLLTLNIDNNVMPKVELFVKTMGMSFAKATKLIVDSPAVLGRSRYSLLSSYNSLIAAGFEQKTVVLLLQAHPRILVCGCRYVG